MQISVIIVNYKVKFLLENCIRSVLRAAQFLQAEIIVVDNNSQDKSVAYLKPLFPQVLFIENKTNYGFAKACNQGAAIASGDFFLFLNPDTEIPENVFSKCISFLEAKPACGAVGVRMVNEKNEFLKESKRSAPALSTYFFKLFGLSKIFPKSNFFSGYYLENLSEKENHEVPVLAGAFMLLRKNVFLKIKGFDEDFFMYGEDIDLSCRAIAAGYKNYYLGEITIMHQKGKSTDFNHQQINRFYDAMKIFVRKYYTNKMVVKNSLLIAIEIRKQAAHLHKRLNNKQ